MSNTTALPKVCAECGKRTNKVNRSEMNPEVCNSCYAVYELELSHEEGQHDDSFAKGCPACDEEKENDRGEIDPIRYEEPETAQEDAQEDVPATKQAHFDHSACDHPKTAKDRAQCRKTGLAAVFHGVISELPSED